jgi:hypothetical protein
VERKYSILRGRDPEALSILFDIHVGADDPRILDCTYNQGTMWKGLDYKPVRMDIDPSFELDVVGDFRDLGGLFPANSFDVLVFDPPHLPSSAASPKSSKMWKMRYGITNDPTRCGDNVSPLFLPFLSGAKEILRPDGVILAKIADLTHNHRYQWQHIDFINAVFSVGLTPCDMLIKVDPAAGNLKSSKWKNVKHLRKCHCYWIVVRNSTRCEVK